MKNTIKALVIIALVAVIGFAFAACGDKDDDDGNGGNNGGNGDGDKTEAAFSVSGKFNKDGGEEVKFKLSTDDNIARSARAVTTESYAVSGELEDGDIVFRLSGTYDPVELNYTASASSSLIRYSISGAFDSDGNSLGSTATLLVKNSTGDDWTAFYYEVDEAAVVITGTPTTEVVTGGFPEEVWGSYSVNVGQGVYVSLLVSQWTVEYQTVTTSAGNKKIETQSSSVLEVENKDSYYDVILGYYRTGFGIDPEKGEIGYMKYRLSYTSNSVTICQYYIPSEEGEEKIQSSFNTIAEARAVTTIDTNASATFTR